MLKRFFWFKSYWRLRGSRLFPRNFFCCGKSQLPTENRWTRRASVYCIQGTSPCFHQTHLLKEFLESWLLHCQPRSQDLHPGQGKGPGNDVAALLFYSKNWHSYTFLSCAIHFSYSWLLIPLDANSLTVLTNTIDFAYRFERRQVHRWSPVVSSKTGGFRQNWRQAACSKDVYDILINSQSVSMFSTVIAFSVGKKHHQLTSITQQFGKALVWTDLNRV